MSLKNKLVLPCLGAAAALATGCQTPPDPATAYAGSSTIYVEGELPPPSSTSPVQPADLVITPLDELEIRVFGVDELSGKFQVDGDGVLKLPLIGSVEALGLSNFELATVIEDRLVENYLQEADVTVRLLDSVETKLLTVEGAVEEPGLFPVKNKLTLLQAIALSGGLAEGANEKRVIVFREIEGERHGAAFDLRKVRRGEVEDPLIVANDVIVVDGGNLQESYREFLRSVPLLMIFTRL